jgi:hypothetical protein
MTVDKVFDCEIFCDASNVGFGGFVNSVLDYHLENIETFGNWTESKSLESYQSLYFNSCCGLEVQNPTQALKSVKGPGNTFDINAK